jgi:hypothetical protein
VWGKKELVFGNNKEASIEAIGHFYHSLMNHPLSPTKQVMTKLTKCLLMIAVTGLVSGGMVDFSGLDLNPLFTVLLPAGAVFLALSLISLLLEEAMARYDKEETEKMRWVQSRLSPPRRGSDSGTLTNPPGILQTH